MVQKARNEAEKKEPSDNWKSSTKELALLMEPTESEAKRTMVAC